VSCAGWRLADRPPGSSQRTPSSGRSGSIVNRHRPNDHVWSCPWGTSLQNAGRYWCVGVRVGQTKEPRSSAAQSLRSARSVALSHVPLSAPQSGIARRTSSAGTCGCNAITVGAPNLSNTLCNRLQCLRPKERKQIPFGRPPHIRFPAGRDGARGCARVGHREIPAPWVW
jgi:hypothetical protein